MYNYMFSIKSKKMEEFFELNHFPDNYKNLLLSIQRLYDLSFTVTPFNVENNCKEIFNILISLDYPMKYSLFYDFFTKSAMTSKYLLPYTSKLVYSILQIGIDQNWDLKLYSKAFQHSYNPNDPTDLYSYLACYNDLLSAYIVRYGLLPYNSYLLLLIAKFFDSHPITILTRFFIIEPAVPHQTLKDAHAKAYLSIGKKENRSASTIDTFNDIIDNQMDKFNPYLDIIHNTESIDIITAILHDDLDYFIGHVDDYFYFINEYENKSKIQKSNLNNDSRIDSILEDFDQEESIKFNFYNIVAIENQELIALPFMSQAKKICLFLLTNASEKELLRYKFQIFEYPYDIDVIKKLSTLVKFYPSDYSKLVAEGTTDIVKWCLPFINGNVILDDRFNNITSPFLAIVHNLYQDQVNKYNDKNASYYYLHGISLLISRSSNLSNLILSCYKYNLIECVEAFVKYMGQFYGIETLIEQNKTFYYLPHFNELLFKYLKPTSVHRYNKIITILMNSNPTNLFSALKFIPISIVNSYETNNGFPLLCHFSILGNTNYINALLELDGIDINNDLHPENAAPIHYACYYGYTKIVELLIQTGILDVNRKDGYGKTAISYTRNPSIVKMLLSNGAILQENDEDDDNLMGYSNRDFIMKYFPKEFLIKSPINQELIFQYDAEFRYRPFSNNDSFATSIVSTYPKHRFIPSRIMNQNTWSYQLSKNSNWNAGDT